MNCPSVAKIIGLQKSVHIDKDSIFLKTMQEFSGESVWVLGIVYIVEFSDEAGIIISYDHLVFTPILCQIVEIGCLSCQFRHLGCRKRQSLVPGWRQI